MVGEKILIKYLILLLASSDMVKGLAMAGQSFFPILLFRKFGEKIGSVEVANFKGNFSRNKRPNY
jgi:hypothetical protein